MENKTEQEELENLSLLIDLNQLIKLSQTHSKTIVALNNDLCNRGKQRAMDQSNDALHMFKSQMLSTYNTIKG